MISSWYVCVKFGSLHHFSSSLMLYPRLFNQTTKYTSEINMCTQVNKQQSDKSNRPSARSWCRKLLWRSWSRCWCHRRRPQRSRWSGSERRSSLLRGPNGICYAAWWERKVNNAFWRINKLFIATVGCHRRSSKQRFMSTRNLSLFYF